jgi:Septum formation
MAKFSDQWVRIPAPESSGMIDLKIVPDLEKWISNAIYTTKVPVRKGVITQLAQDTVPITLSNGDEYYIATTGTPYLVRFTAATGGSFDLFSFGESFPQITSPEGATDARTYVEMAGPGTCYLADKNENITKFVPCTTAHKHEIYANVRIHGTGYPGETEVRDRLNKECGVAFESYVGIPVSQSTKYGYWYWLPRADDWRARDHYGECYAYPLDNQPRTGSVKNSKE